MRKYGVCAPHKPAIVNNYESVRHWNEIERMFNDKVVCILCEYE